MMYRVSSSIANFAPGLARKYPTWKQFSWWNIYEPCVFFGMYHIWDVARLIWHRGKQTVFWTGSDILNMQKSPFLLGMVQGCNARHICENKVEQDALLAMGIEAEIKPQLFDVVRRPILSHIEWEGRKQVYLCAHEYRQGEYGVWEVMDVSSQVPSVDFHIYGVEGLSYGNLYFHGKVSQEQFIEEIKHYHCGLRLNEFDGFSEVLARSALLGQYQISRIEYPYMLTAHNTEDLVCSLRVLETASQPNLEGQDYWFKELSKSL